jgi:hypothetical protein
MRHPDTTQGSHSTEPRPSELFGTAFQIKRLWTKSSPNFMVLEANPAARAS